MDINDLECLLQVIRHGSFASAAREMNVDPSSVSRSIAALERELGTRLFQRNTRQLALTEAGSVFAERLAPVLEELSQARDAAVDATGVVRGRLRVSVSNAFGVRRLSPLLPAFCKAHPSLELDVLMGETPLDLVAQRVDVALRAGNLRDSSLVAVPLMQIRYHVVASPAWVAAQPQRPMQPQDLSAISCLSFSMLGFRDRWMFTPQGGSETVEVPVRPRIVSTNVQMLRESALADMGPALLASWLIDDDLAAGRLVDLFPSHTVGTANSPGTLWAVYPSRSHVPAKVRVFIDFLKSALQ